MGFPDDFDKFYNRFDKQEEPEEDPKGKDKGKGDKGDKGGKKGKGDPKDDPNDMEEEGTTAVVQHFIEQINQYTETWENKDESNNFDQRHDRELARKAVFPIVEAEL